MSVAKATAAAIASNARAGGGSLLPHPTSRERAWTPGERSFCFLNPAVAACGGRSRFCRYAFASRCRGLRKCGGGALSPTRAQYPGSSDTILSPPSVVRASAFRCPRSAFACRTRQPRAVTPPFSNIFQAVLVRLPPSAVGPSPDWNRAVGTSLRHILGCILFLFLLARSGIGNAAPDFDDQARLDRAPQSVSGA